MIETPDARPLSVQEAADRVGVSRYQLVQLVESGLLPSHRDGWHRCIKPEDLAAWAERSGPWRREGAKAT